MARMHSALLVWHVPTQASSSTRLPVAGAAGIGRCLPPTATGHRNCAPTLLTFGLQRQMDEVVDRVPVRDPSPKESIHQTFRIDAVLRLRAATVGNADRRRAGIRPDDRPRMAVVLAGARRNSSSRPGGKASGCEPRAADHEVLVLIQVSRLCTWSVPCSTGHKGPGVQ